MKPRASDGLAVYLALGGRRSQVRVHVALVEQHGAACISLTTVSNWSRRDDWVGKARIHDAAAERKIAEASSDRVAKDISARIATLERISDTASDIAAAALDQFLLTITGEKTDARLRKAVLLLAEKPAATRAFVDIAISSLDKATVLRGGISDRTEKQKIVSWGGKLDKYRKLARPAGREG